MRDFRPRVLLLLAALGLLGLMAETEPALTQAALRWPHFEPLIFVTTYVTPVLLVLFLFLGLPFALSAIWVALFVPTRREPDRSWRAQTKLYRVRPALRAKTLNETAAACLSRLSDDEVRVAAILPDHSEAGRAAAEAEARQRGLSGAAPMPRVPGFLAGIEAERMEERLFGHRAGVRRLVWNTALAAIAIGVGCYGWNDLTIEALEKTLADPAQADALRAWFEYTPTLGVTPELKSVPGIEFIYLRKMVTIVAGSVWALAWFGGKLSDFVRGRPARILLLRKFNDARLGRYYSRLIREELLAGGQVVALSDKFVRRSPFLWIADQIRIATGGFGPAIFVICTFPVALLLRAFDRTRWGPAYVSRARDFRNLAKRLWDRIGVNMAAVQDRRGYLVRTTDAWWRLVVMLLMQSADVIVLDLSDVTDGTLWEIDALSAGAFWHKVVCIAHKDRVNEAVVQLHEAGAPHALREQPVSLYDFTGVFENQAAFRAQFAEAAISSTYSTNGSAAPIAGGG